MKVVFSVILLALLTLSAEAQTVFERRGNIFLGEVEIQLTFSGRDSDPSLSPDGSLVVFVRETSNMPIETGLGDAPDTKLWVMDINSKKAEKVLDSRASEDLEEVLAEFRGPQFSPDGKSIYFLSTAWAVTGAIHRFDLTTREERFISPGGALRVIREGEHKGYLKVWKHKYNEHGSYDCEYLLTPDGVEVRAIDEECDRRMIICD